MEPGGYLALAISLALWGFIIFAIVLAIRSDDSNDKEKKKAKK